MTAAEDLWLLQERITEIFSSHGLSVHQVGFTPDSGETLGVHIVAGLAQDDTPKTDDGFDEVIASAAQAEADRRKQQSIEDLTERLRRDDGFL